MEAHLRKHSLSYLMFGLTMTLQTAAHPWGGSPMVAYPAYAGCFLSLKASIPLTIAMSILNDIYVHYMYFPDSAIIGWSSLFVIGALCLNAVLANYVMNERNYASRCLPTGFAASFLFFLITNFGAWLSLNYAKTWSGLVECYAMGVPFWKNQFLFTMSFTILIFGIHKLVEIFGQNYTKREHHYMPIKTQETEVQTTGTITSPI